jgi:hypothetical protein
MTVDLEAVLAKAKRKIADLTRTIEEQSEGHCKFNCRTPREVFDLGVVCGKQGTDPDRVWAKRGTNRE